MNKVFRLRTARAGYAEGAQSCALSCCLWRARYTRLRGAQTRYEGTGGRIQYRMKFGKVARAARLALPFAVIFAVFCALIFFPHGAAPEAEERRVVRVWNVDTFEGGKGSRTSFLARAARLAEKTRGNVYYYVSSYSAEGFREAAEKGDLPEILSFGVGIGDISALCKPLSFDFAGGRTARGSLAGAWCAGGYAIFSLTDDFDEAGKVAVSCGGCNLPAVCAALEGIEGEELSSGEAYTAFLSGKYRYLLGTQRDRQRFLTRGVAVYERPLEGFCDLYQAVAVLSEDEKGDCAAFLQALFSEEIQGALSDIGMKRAAECTAEWTVSVFTPPSALAETAEYARQGEVAKFPDKFLKKV